MIHSEIIDLIVVEENKYLRTLTENAQQGKIVALEELYEINLKQVHTLVSRLAGNKILAEQLTKNILVRAWERISEDGPGEQLFSDWLRELSVHITVDELREPNLITDKKFKKQLKKDRHNADYSSNPSEKIIAQLDLEHRIIYVLNKIENYSLVEVSNFMGINPSEAETKLAESIEKISQGLSEINKEKKLKVDWLNLLAVIEPDEDILESTFEEIKEIRSAEVKEEEEVIEAERKEEIAELEKEIEKERKEKEKEKRGKRNWGDILPVFSNNKKIVFGVMISLIVIFLLIQFTSSSNNWSVSSLKGTPFINEAPVERSDELAINDVITTDELSLASIEIPEVGIVEMSKKTKLIRPDSELTLEIIKGSVDIYAEKATANLSLKIPNAVIKELNTVTNYSVRVDDRRNSIVNLEKGWLRVYSGDVEIVFPEKHMLNVYSNSGTSVPYHISSTTKYIALLDEYLFGGKRDRTLKRILAASSKKEAITLWNLLFRVDAGHQVENVYYKLSELAPHSEAVTKVDVLLLNPDILNKWLEEIKQQL